MKLRAITAAAVTAAIAVAQPAIGGPSFSKRIAKLERQMRAVSALSISTSDQVDALQAKADGASEVRVAQASIPTDSTGAAHGSVQCPVGYLATGGGGAFEQAHGGDHLVYSTPDVNAGQPTGWQVAAATYNGGAGTLLVDVVCVNAP